MPARLYCQFRSNTPRRRRSSDGARATSGRTGFIGARIVRELVQRGEDVVCFDLAPPKADLEPYLDKISVYRGDVTQARGTADFVRIDMTTGVQTEFLSGLRRPMGTSPDGAWYVYLADEQVHAVELATLEAHNLSERAGVDFVNREFDQVDEAPAHGVAG